MNPDGIDLKISADTAFTSSIQGEVQHLEQLAKGGAKNLKAVAEKFEALFLGYLIKQMWASIGEKGLFGDSPGGHVYEGMITTMLSDHIAKQGGIGMADNLVARFEAARAYEAPVDSVAVDPDAPGDRGENAPPPAGARGTVEEASNY